MGKKREKRKKGKKNKHNKRSNGEVSSSSEAVDNMKEERARHPNRLLPRLETRVNSVRTPSVTLSPCPLRASRGDIDRKEIERRQKITTTFGARFGATRKSTESVPLLFVS